MARKWVGAEPAVAKDIPNLSQVYAVGGNPPSGCWAMPWNNLASTTSAVTSGQVCFWRIDIGPKSLPIQAIGCSVNTAQVGGTTTTTLGIYPDDGSGGLPDCSNGPLYSGTVVLTSTGVRTVSVSATLPPGRYWGAFLYRSTVTPSTLPVMVGSGNAVSLWITTAAFGSSTTAYGRYLALTSQTALPTSQPSVASWTTPVNSLGVLVGIQAT